MSQAFEIFPYPLYHDVAVRGRVDLTSLQGDAEHEILLVTPKHCQANVNAPTNSQIRKRVQWHTRRTRHISIDDEILAEALRLEVSYQDKEEEEEAEQQDESSPTQRRQRLSLSALQSQPLLLSSSPRTPSSDPSWNLDNDRRSEPEEDTSDDSKTIARSLRLQARTLA
ncbi:hypothetical protein BCV69DRAFT_73416 [Microstroma glucosiphilum]|uniref:Uncharacterized protein n=1 Tax=Pseudomicrostroma glucosiphilum TaxID=1684307 RepID=A0A316TZ02_9BASI|nr:hypothetical protein BCV69DRAFT_73416 [Pseudomicrostroma glucosiphilum]PWN18432.1 hypothetical protein BCV69DRAFT_73416 [Pseudomicrostroma glucosiphilum]